MFRWRRGRQQLDYGGFTMQLRVLWIPSSLVLTSPHFSSQVKGVKSNGLGHHIRNLFHLLLLLLLAGACIVRYRNVLMKDRQREEELRLIGVAMTTRHPQRHAALARAPASPPPMKVHSPDPTTGLVPGTTEHVQFGTESGEAFVAEPASQADFGRPALGRPIEVTVVRQTQSPRPKTNANQNRR